MELTPSPLAQELPQFESLEGLTCYSVGAQIRYTGRDDLALMTFDEASTCAAVFTRSQCRSAAVDWSREVLANQQARAIIVNSGNANAFTGKAGEQANAHLAALGASMADCTAQAVFTASTGVIGEVIEAVQLERAQKILKTSAPVGLERVARAIMTTDTFAKGAVEYAQFGDQRICLQGVAKGSGMIAPDMATMLAFLFTDAQIDHRLLQRALEAANAVSFNAVTVDSDTSTSDSVYLVATGRAQHPALEAESPAYQEFCAALQRLMVNLARQIAGDGEGAQKRITIEVAGAVSDRSAQLIAKSIADSPLVKTAIAGEDANWGRVVMAIGKAGEPAQRDELTIAMGGVAIAAKGAAVAEYDEAMVSEHLKGSEILINVDLGLGDGFARVWTCDLTHAYIDINADYRS